jgi:glycosyltransferase involved in cell wall biosynthesis
MRILNIIESLGRGGAEQVLLNVLPELQARGHDCEVAALWGPYSLQDDLEARGVRVHRLHGDYSERWNLGRGVGRVVRLARRRRCDVLHSHLLFPDLYVGLSRAILPGPLRVASLQNTDFDFLQSTIPGRVARRVLPPVLRHGFDGLAAVGTPVAQHFREHVPGLEVETIFNAVPIPSLQHNTRRAEVLKSWDADAEAFTLLTAARLAPEKNHVVLFEALELLRTRGLTPQVLLAGAGPLRSELEALVKKKSLGGQVRFCGRVEHADLQELLGTVDAFVLPSKHEGLPLAIAEAMALQRPVLATSVGGVPDIVEDNITGLLVPASDANALASGIERLMRDSALRQRLGEEGRRRVEKKFSAPAIAQQWEEFYGRLMKAR